MEKLKYKGESFRSVKSGARSVRSILVVDDELRVRTLFREVLEKVGYAVAVAAGANEGMTLLRENPVDLVITDIFMPDKDGHDFISEIQQAFPNVVIFAMTGKRSYDSGLELDLAQSLGAAKVFMKPCRLSELLRAIKGVSFELEKREPVGKHKMAEFFHSAFKQIRPYHAYIGSAAAVAVFWGYLLFGPLHRNFDPRLIESVGSRISQLERRIEQIEQRFAGSENRLSSIGRLTEKADRLKASLGARLEELAVLTNQITAAWAKETPLNRDSADAAKDFRNRAVLRTHVVRAGESLYRISRLYQVRVSDLMEWNNLPPGGIIRPGQVLQVAPDGAP